MSTDAPLHLSDLEKYLSQLAKEYKKMGGRHRPIEIIIVGGAAIVLSYRFRLTTTDVDILPTYSVLFDAAKKIRDANHLSDDWINADFRFTKTFTLNLVKYSTFYKTYNQVLNVRVVKREYLIVMKLYSFRSYKYDISDISGILYEHHIKRDDITYNQIDKAVKNLYGGWKDFKPEAIRFIKELLDSKDYKKKYKDIREKEKSNRQIIETAINNHPELPVGKLTAEEIIAKYKKKTKL